MRIEECGKNNYSIFLTKEFCCGRDIEDKDELISFIKDFILKFKNKLNMRGFYKVRVFPQERVGIFLDVVKIDDIDLTNNLDLRIIVMNDSDIFFGTEYYEIIKDSNEKRYLDGLFYCIVDDSFDQILEKVEWGRFIYGKDVINLLTKGLIL